MWNTLSSKTAPTGEVCHAHEAASFSAFLWPTAVMAEEPSGFEYEWMDQLVDTVGKKDRQSKEEREAEIDVLSVPLDVQRPRARGFVRKGRDSAVEMRTSVRRADDPVRGAPCWQVIIASSRRRAQTPEAYRS